jgi:hypothetical protein
MDERYKKIRLAPPPPPSLIEMRGELRTPYNVHESPLRVLAVHGIQMEYGT